ncbi:MAG: hypothetical protein R2712_04455 [Vicinamibacterales bacterium]
MFMRRDLDEVLASQNAMLESRGEARGAADARMRAVYEEHLAQVERFVARRDCFATLWLDYARVVASPGTEADRMARFLGRSLDLAKMAQAVDATRYGRAEGKSDSEVDAHGVLEHNSTTNSTSSRAHAIQTGNRHRQRPAVVGHRIEHDPFYAGNAITDRTPACRERN